MLETMNHHDVAIGAPPGEHYTATVPDTLDLAERAALAVNALTNFRPDEGYAITQTFRFSHQPPMIGPPNWLTPKFLRTLPLVRLMCGSNQNLDAEKPGVESVPQPNSLRRFALLSHWRRWPPA